MNVSKLLQQAGQHLSAGDPAAAQAILSRVLRKKPTNIDALNLAGLAAYQCNDLLSATQLLTKVIRKEPRRISARLNLGVVLNSQNQHHEAEDNYRAVLAIEPSNAVALCNLGKNFLDQNQLCDAERWFNAALEADPNYWIALHNLGTCLQRLGQIDSAIDTYRRALQLNENPESLSELIATLRRTDRFTEEYALAKQLLAMPAAGDVAIGAWETLFDAFDWARIEQSQEKILALLQDPMSRHETRGGGLILLNSLTTVDPADSYSCHRAWATALPPQPKLEPIASANSIDFSRLRIGYLSPDFREHSVGFFIRNVIRAHDDDHFAVYCYSNSACSDSLTEEVATAATAYIDVTQMSDADLGQRIRDDRIDILIDLAGHTRDSRLAVMRSRLAPVQISYLGYPNTTGLDTIDYRITDPYADCIDGTEYSESLLTLPESFLCFGHFDEVECRPDTPAADIGQVTFGCFNNIRKITPTVVEAWSAILKAVPNARLKLKSRRAGDPITQGHLREAFTSHDIDPKRIDLLPVCGSRTDHLDAYNGIDIALDTFPYNGTTTTCEALWMGVPVVTLAGSMHAQRVSYSILKNLALDDLTCWTHADYVARCVELANDHTHLNQMRVSIRSKIRNSILCNPERFARQFEEALLRACDKRTQVKPLAANAV